MASFPASVKSFTTKATGNTIQAAHVNDLQDEVNAIETDLSGGSTNEVYVGGVPPGFASTVSLHRLESSQVSVTGASTLGTLQAGASTLGTLQAANSTLNALQVSSNSTFTGSVTISSNLTVVGSITNAGIPVLLAGSTFATASTAIVDLSTFSSSFTALDSLEILYVIEASTCAINNIRIRNKTDGVTVVDLNDQAGSGDFTAARSGVGDVVIRMAPSATTKILAKNALRTSANTAINTGEVATFTTPWTDSIEYAIQGACTTNTGNIRGSWQVYKRPGQ